MQINQLILPVAENIRLLIYSSNAELFEDIDSINQGLSQWQLLEGSEYDFEILEGDKDADTWTIEGADGIFIINSKHTNRGKIKTGIYVGTLSFNIVNTKTGVKTQLSLEVRSTKIDYKQHYQKMLTDITSFYVDLVMQQESPISQTFDIDFDASQKTLYQKFSFLKGIIENDAFEEAVHKVIANPVRKWSDTVEDVRIESVRKFSKNAIKQISRNTNRIPANNGILGINSMPRSISVTVSKDTLDTAENQFIKYVLTTFIAFCEDLQTKKNASPQLRREVQAVCEKLTEHLNCSFFKHISQPNHLNIGSPVLQRKEGYREILQAWLMFDLTAKITWEGGDVVYNAGKRNIAALYEYWLYFQLIKIVCEVFHINIPPKNDLVKTDKDKISLNIRQGCETLVSGKCYIGARLLNINLCYNKTFSYQQNISKIGSWTIPMRPDYTLSIWPGEKSIHKAEEDNSIVHIHFDAKYRMDHIIIKGDECETLEEVNAKLDQDDLDRELDIYKRGDLLKMHAYKDAIRRTAGAYILYPGRNNGSENNSGEDISRGYHEIIPGLGAFQIAPGYEDRQVQPIKKFLKDILEHFLNRISQREKIAITEHQIHKDCDPKTFKEYFPEVIEEGAFVDSIDVLVCHYIDTKHLEWIEKHKKYGLKLGGDSPDSARILSKAFLNASYLLLYSMDGTSIRANKLMKIEKHHPALVSDQYLQSYNHPHLIKGQTYLLYTLSEVEDKILSSQDWRVQGILDGTGAPIVVKYTKLVSDE